MLLQYFKSRDGLPDLNGSLSSVMASKTVAVVNREVDKKIEAAKARKTRGPYMK